MFAAFNMNYGNLYKVQISVVDDYSKNDDITWNGDEYWNYWFIKDANNKSVYIATMPNSARGVQLNALTSAPQAYDGNLWLVVWSIFNNQPNAKGAFCVR